MRLRPLFLSIGIGLHCLAVVVIGILFYATGAMTGWCVFPAALIGCASVPAVPGRPIPLYAGFGLFMGLSFWTLISGLKQLDVLVVLLALVMTAGSAWLLRAPSWPAAGFTGAAVLLSLALSIVMLAQRPDWDDLLPDRARRSAITVIGVVSLASAYAGVGFAEIVVRDWRAAARKLRKKKRRLLEAYEE
jgi:hypothetical protein